MAAPAHKARKDLSDKTNKETIRMGFVKVARMDIKYSSIQKFKADLSSNLRAFTDSKKRR